MFRLRYYGYIQPLTRAFRRNADRPSIGLGTSRIEQDGRIQKLLQDTRDRLTEMKSSKDGKMSKLLQSHTNDDIMKISFAEGYFHGQESKKKAKFRFFTFFKEAVWLAVIGVIGYNLFYGDVSLRKTVLGRSLNEIQPEDVNVTFIDVKGCDEAKKELADIVDFLKRPHIYSRLGAKLPKGVLLYGPPGTGKTLLARAVAGQAGVPFYHASGSEFDEVLVGQGARRVRELFEKAKQRTPCVIFIDEIDTIGAKRTSSQLHPYANQTVNQLLSEMDGFLQNEGIIVIGATNRLEVMDPAILRPGRFDVQVSVGKPDYDGRRELFEHYLSKVRVSLDVDVERLCRKTIGLTGADIENLVNQAALKAAIDDMDVITEESLEYAHDKIAMGPEKRWKTPNAEDNLLTAYHESGHALVAYLTKSTTLHKVTIIPRGQSLGHTQPLPDRDGKQFTKERILAQIDFALGGRIAEELIYGANLVTTGSSDDLRKANGMAVSLVKHYGMSEKVGMRVLYDDIEPDRHMNDETAKIFETEIARVLDESRQRVTNLLTNHMTELKLLAQALMKYETLNYEEVKLILEGKDPRPSAPRPEPRTDRKHRANTKVSDSRLPLDLLK